LSRSLRATPHRACHPPPVPGSGFDAMTIPACSWKHPFAGASRSRRHVRFIPAPASPARHHRPVVHQPVECGNRGQSTLINGFQLSAFLAKPSPPKTATTPNPHRRPSAHPIPRVRSSEALGRRPPLPRVDRSPRAGIRNPSRERTTANARFQPELIALDREVVS
jgi:hypothetical protein